MRRFGCTHVYLYTYMYVHRDMIVHVALIPQLCWIQLLTYMCVCVLQIRQEKPYYIADPEVDSLVSYFIYLFIYMCASEIFVAFRDIVYSRFIISLSTFL